MQESDHEVRDGNLRMLEYYWTDRNDLDMVSVYAESLELPQVIHAVDQIRYAEKVLTLLIAEATEEL